MTRLDEIGEIAMIERLAPLLPCNADVALAVGDDCAVVRSASDGDRDWLLTSDAVVGDVHFRADTPGEQVGHKAVGRALSDIAAMGGRPRWALTNLTAPGAAPVAYIEAIYRGMAALAQTAGLAIVGGDTTSGPALQVHVFAVGDVPHGAALLRSGARPGDGVYVTGELGGSGGGHHLRFMPRLAAGEWLRESGFVSAMIDLSDGMATDLRHIADRSGCGARVETARLPISAAAAEATEPGAAVVHALCDGEDYELLFTIAADNAAAFTRAWDQEQTLPCRRIGVMTDTADRIDYVDAAGAAVEIGSGYQHFS